MDKKEQARLRKQRQRDRERDKTPQDVTLSVTEQVKSVTPDVTQYHPIMSWLIPGEKRDKLEKICQSVGDHKQLPNVYLGASRHSLPLDIVGELLEVTG